MHSTIEEEWKKRRDIIRRRTYGMPAHNRNKRTKRQKNLLREAEKRREEIVIKIHDYMITSSCIGLRCDVAAGTRCRHLDGCAKPNSLQPLQCTVLGWVAFAEKAIKFYLLKALVAFLCFVCVCSTHFLVFTFPAPVLPACVPRYPFDTCFHLIRSFNFYVCFLFEFVERWTTSVCGRQLRIDASCCPCALPATNIYIKHIEWISLWPRE